MCGENNRELRAFAELDCAGWFSNYCSDACSYFAVMAGKSYHMEAMRAAMTLGLNRLGSDRTYMPPKDISIRPGSLLAREHAVRMWWEILTQ